MSDGNPANDSSKAERVSGTISFTPGDTPAVVTIGGVAVTGVVGQVFNGSHGTLTIIAGTNLATGTIKYTYTLTDNTIGNGAHDNFNVVVTDADNDTVSGTLRINIVDDRPHATDFNGTIENAVGENLVGLIDYGLGADGFGGVNLTYAGATSNGASIALKSNGATVSVASVDTNGDGLKEVLGFVDTGSAGYDAGDRLVFSLAPTVAGAAYGEYALTLSDVLDLPRDPINLSFSGIDAGGPVPQIQVGANLLISGVAGGLINANSDYIGAENNVMNDGETVKYNFGTVTGGTTINPGDEIFVNDLRFDIFQTGGPSADQISYTVRNTVTGESASGFLTIPGGSGATGYTGPINAAFDYNEIEFSVTEGDFKVGGIQYTQLGESEDILMAFSYTATDGDGDAIAGGFSVTVTDDVGATDLAATGDVATITSIGQEYVPIP
jgi:hypothetical protein